jgi:hypothetical protein
LDRYARVIPTIRAASTPSRKVTINASNILGNGLSF